MSLQVHYYADGTWEDTISEPYEEPVPPTNRVATRMAEYALTNTAWSEQPSLLEVYIVGEGGTVLAHGSAGT